MSNKATVLKNEAEILEEKVKNGKVKLFNWGWFKFSKCILGAILYAAAINLFVVPNHLYTGGILGLSQIIRSFLITKFGIVTNFDLSSIIYYLLNLPLVILAYKKISKTFFIRTIFTVTVNSLFLFLIPIPEAPLIDNVLANVIIAGIIGGQGIGMILSTGSSSGGTDIIGVAINQKVDKISVGSVGLTFNILIYIITAISFGIEIMIYSIMFAAIESIVLDKTHTPNIKSETIVFTKKEPTKMIEFINKELNRGTTYWEAIGGYTNTKTYMVYTVLSKYERMRLERHMEEFDSKAFMIGNDGISVKGKFEKYIV